MNRRAASRCLPGVTLLLSSSLLVVGCGSGGSTTGSGTDASTNDGTLGVEEVGPGGGTALTDAIADIPEGTPESGGAGLVLDTRGDCASAGETVSLALFSRDADIGLEPEGDTAGLGRNVTAFTAFSLQSDSRAAVNVISHGDTQIDLAILSPDIIGLTARFLDASVTDFIAAWPADAPAEAVLQADRGNGVCLYSMRLPGFCGTVRSTGSEFSLAFNDQVLEARGCEIDAMPDLPLIRLQ